MAGGRPTKYSRQLGELICDKIANSPYGLVTICKDPSLPDRSTVRNWIRDIPEFLDLYEKAKADQADFMADEMLEIADNTEEGQTTKDGPNGVEITTGDMLAHRRLKIETRKWLAMKLKPKKYGEKLDVTTDGEKITQFNVGFKKPDEENTGN